MVTYQHRGSMVQYDNGPRMVFLGGAPSIDYKYREKGRSWWPEETITQSDVDTAVIWANAPVDVIVTHDCVIKPAGFKETSDMTFNYKAQINHDCLRQACDRLKPTLNVHGHYHHRYEGAYKDMKIIGLAANMNAFPDTYYIYEYKEKM
jgi:hypothetical protein